jgi:gliding motility-associated protein GldM
MALPKEPRQKMINLMYLVLTALLALNVSNEILNAFKTVDNSLLNSNDVIKSSNQVISASLAEQGKKPELASKVAIWKPKADSAIGLANAMAAYIEDLKKRLKQESDLQVQDGVEVYKEDDLDAATRLMDVKGEGPKLQNALQQYMDNLKKLIPADLQAKMPKLPIDLSVPKSNNRGNNTWTRAYFHMTPSVAGLTILSKFQNDVLRSGNLVAEFAQNQIGKVEVVLDKFEILTSQNSTYLLPGQTLEVKAGIGAFSSAAKPTITINGVSQVANDSGFARYTTTIGGGGSGSVPVTVSFKDPNTGETVQKSTTVNYTVGQASGASIFLEKMNVMYVGVDNPLTISSGSGKRENARVTFTGGSISSAGGDKYIAKPTETGPATVSITVDGKTFPVPIRCKLLPDPIALVGTLKGGRVQSAQFKASGGVRAALQDSEFDAQFQVVSYTLAGNGAGFQQYTPVQINGAQWGSNAVITQAKPGSSIFLDDIIVRGPDGRNRKLPPIAFQLQ